MTILKYEGEKLNLNLYKYTDGNLAVVLTCDEGPFATVSVNLPESSNLGENTFYVKHWGQEGIIKALVDQNIIIEAKDVPPTRSGYVDNIKAYRLVNGCNN